MSKHYVDSCDTVIHILSIDGISRKVREDGTDEIRNILKMATECFKKWLFTGEIFYCLS